LWVEQVQLAQLFHYMWSVGAEHREHAVRVGHVGICGVLGGRFGLALTQVPDRDLGAVHTGDQQIALD